MAIHARKDFARLCGMEPRQLSVHIKREQVILTKENKVDDQVAENAEFFESRKKNSGDIQIEVVPRKFSKNELKDAELKLKRTEIHNDLNTTKKKLENQELEEKIQLYKIRKETLEGYVIPVDLVKEVFRQHFRKITVHFHQGAENLILEISKKKS